MYAELKSIIFTLEQLESNIGNCIKAIIYTDVYDIARILGDDPLFKKNHSLQIVRNELKAIYYEKQLTITFDFSIKYLPRDKKKFNPFHRSAHNASNKLIRSAAK